MRTAKIQALQSSETGLAKTLSASQLTNQPSTFVALRQISFVPALSTPAHTFSVSVTFLLAAFVCGEYRFLRKRLLLAFSGSDLQGSD